MINKIFFTPNNFRFFLFFCNIYIIFFLSIYHPFNIGNKPASRFVILLLLTTVIFSLSYLIILKKNKDSWFRIGLLFLTFPILLKISHGIIFDSELRFLIFLHWFFISSSILIVPFLLKEQIINFKNIIINKKQISKNTVHSTSLIDIGEKKSIQLILFMLKLYKTIFKSFI
jgi:hypothetical protein